MNPNEVVGRIDALRRRGIRLQPQDTGILVRPRSKLMDEDREWLRQHRDDVLCALASEGRRTECAFLSASEQCPQDTTSAGYTEFPPAGEENRVEWYLSHVEPVTKAQMIPISTIIVDPEAMQWRFGTGRGGTKSSNRIPAYIAEANTEPFVLWRRPEDGRVLVVDGHHRYDAAIRKGEADVPAIFVHTPYVRVARVVGALRNILSASIADPLDVARFVRDTGLGAAELKMGGVRLQIPALDTGVALANLSDALWHCLLRGDLPPAIGAIIGRQILDPLLQDLFYQTAKGHGLSDPAVTEIAADRFSRARIAATQQQTLFGDGIGLRSYYLEEAYVIRAFRRALAEDRTLYGRISSEDYAKKVTPAGNLIVAAQNRALASQSEREIAVLDAMGNAAGAVEGLIQKTAVRIADQPKDVASAIIAESLGALRDALYEDACCFGGDSRMGLARRAEPHEGEPIPVTTAPKLPAIE